MDANEVGKELFGRPCWLALALWVLGHHKSRFYQSEPPREVILQGEAAKELRRLVRLGMLEELRPDDARRVYYDRTDSSLAVLTTRAWCLVGSGEIRGSCPVLDVTVVP